MTVLADRIASRFVHTRRLLRADIGVGATHENGTVRIHRFMDTIVVEDITNAGKRGKKVRKMAIIPTHHIKGPDRQGFIDRVTKMIEDYGRYEQIQGRLKDYLSDYPDDLDIHESEERGVDVMPGGFQEITVRGEHVMVNVEYKDFLVKNLDDSANEPTCIPAISGGIKAIPVFYRWVKDNQEKIKKMTFREVLQAMSALDVKYHEFCAID